MHDPMHPVPTIGGNVTSGEPIMTGGAFDQVRRSTYSWDSLSGTGGKLLMAAGVTAVTAGTRAW